MIKSEQTRRRTSLCLGVLSIVIGVAPNVIGVMTQEVEALERIHSEYQFFLVPFWFLSTAMGILAIVTGRSAKFKFGVVLGRIGAGISAFFFLVTLLLFLETISSGRMPCRWHYQEVLNSAIQNYCKQNEGTLPDAEAWCDQLLESVDEVEHFSIETFVGMHSLGGPDEKISWFAFNENLDGCNLSEINRQTVLLFGTDLGWNQNGTSAILQSDGHPGFWPFCEGGYHFVFVGPDSTFTVRFIKNSELDSLNWTPGVN